MRMFLESSVLNCVHHDVGHWHTNIVFQKRYRMLWCSNSSISFICCWICSSFNPSMSRTSSLFDWLIQLSLFLTRVLYFHLNCSHNKWTCWIRFILASSSNSLSIAIAWIAKSLIHLTPLSYQPCYSKEGTAFRSIQNSFELGRAGRNKRLRHLQDTSPGRISCKFPSEADESCRQPSLHDPPSMNSTTQTYQHAKCSNDGFCHVWIEPASRLIAKQNARIVD